MPTRKVVVWPIKPLGHGAQKGNAAHLREMPLRSPPLRGARRSGLVAQVAAANRLPPPPHGPLPPQQPQQPLPPQQQLPLQQQHQRHQRPNIFNRRPFLYDSK